MLAALALLALQAPPQDLTRIDLHALVALIPRQGAEVMRLDPVSQGWSLEPSLWELERRIRAGTTLDLECWRTILIDKGFLRWRAKWPVHVPFGVSLLLPPIHAELELALVSEIPGAEIPRIKAGVPSFPSDCEPALRLGMVTAGPQTIRFDVWPRFASQVVPASVGTISIEVEGVPRIENAMDAADDPQLGAILMRSIRVEPGSTAQCMSVSSPPYLHPDEVDWPARLTTSIDLELLHDGRVVEAGEWWGVRRGRNSPIFFLQKLPYDVADGSRSSRGWTLRVGGTSKRVLRDWDATSYWAGSVEIPLADLIGRSTSPR